MLKAVPSLFMLFVFVAPVMVWLINFGSRGEDGGLSNNLILACLLRTHALAGIVALVSVIAVSPVALWSRMSSRILPRTAYTLIFVPVCVGMLARNHAWIGMLSQRTFWPSIGWTALGGNDLIYTDSAVYIVMTFVFLPWAFFVLQIALSTVSDLQIEAASTLGASQAAIVVRILMPALGRGAFVAFFLVYCTSLGYFITPRMVGPNSGDLAGNVIVSFVNLGDFGIASQLALALLLSSIPFVSLFLVVVNRRNGFLSWQR